MPERGPFHASLFDRRFADQRNKEHMLSNCVIGYHAVSWFSNAAENIAVHTLFHQAAPGEQIALRCSVLRILFAIQIKNYMKTFSSYGSLRL
jgi:hypothetical protein